MRGKTRLRLLLGGLLALLLAACSGGSPAPDFSIALSPASLTVQEGTSDNTTLTLTPQNGFTGTVTLSLVDAGTNNPVSGITLSPPSFTVSTSSPTNQTLTVNVDGSVATGSYSLKVKAVSGSLSKEASLSLSVTAGGGGGGGGSPAPDFTIDLSDKNLMVRQFGIAYTDLTLTPQHGFSGTVDLRLRVRNVPTQFDLLPNQLEVAGGSPFNRRLAIYPTTNPPGTYQLTLEARARSGSPLRTVDFTVVVTPP